ncbi:pyridoxal phosphate-dependent aminotransferase [Jonesia quinghaiensis]|uniref:pyridoxal phosphate-dependent aminotransferase n=1 Tax=Jonesia quinghaiensis TaxID=262806 RepID=UPI00049109B3|nr:aminotransferase class I/II-fold pyridoxal phosphate-dependent enzyme [Jonesia quinghaiensis]
MRASHRSEVPPFSVMQIIAQANARKAAGAPVINLCAGEPAAGASDVVRDEAARVLREGTMGYTESLGVPALRQALSEHYQRWYGVDVDPSRIAVTTGSSGGFVLAFLAAFDVGDRVALARPGYPAYANILRALGVEVVELPCGAQSRFQPTVEQLEVMHQQSPLAGLVVASPANPTGTMISARELERIAQWCVARGVRLISDEIYHGITYPPGDVAASAASFSDEGAIVVSSFSKYWAMTGWRIGWLVLPPELVGPADALAGNVSLCPPALSQYAAVAALSEEGYRAARADVDVYSLSRDVVVDALPALGWSDVAPADGAFYVWANISHSGLDSVTWCRRLLEEADVAMTPGVDFDRVAGHEWLRLSFAQRPQVMKQALERVINWQNAL